jgi:UDP-N-acetylglucosamine 2-epimerase (non-hydrolysing)
LAGALAAAKLQIPIVHIEAGMRSNDLKMPEEINRRMVDSISSLMFCPTRTAMDNLVREGKTSAILTGDIMVDSLDYSLRKASESSILEDNRLGEIEYIYMTLHRPINTDLPSALKTILDAVGECNIPTIMPIHPRTEQRLKDFKLMNDIPSNLKIIPPVGHFSSIQLLKHARCVLTDSGGLQKEAYLLGTPCITLRESTEWPETLDRNRNRLVKIDKESITKAIFESHERFFLPAYTVFGEPGVSKRMVEIVRSKGGAL